MLSVRCTRFLAPNATRLAAPSINRTASGKNQIAESNMFWMRHQIQAKDGYHKHVNFVSDEILFRWNLVLVYF